MTPESLTALGARLMLTRRFYFTPQVVAAMPDDAVIAIAGAALKADDLIHETAVTR